MSEKTYKLTSILEMLQTQKFANWYTQGRLYEFISGDSIGKAPTTGEILKDLSKMLDVWEACTLK